MVHSGGVDPFGEKNQAVAPSSWGEVSGSGHMLVHGWDC